MNKTKGLISIGLPIVKHRHLEKAIKCCLQQSYSNFEIIILNNAKDEATKFTIKQIVDSFKDKRIRYNENKSQIPMIKNWNLCLDLARGELFTMLCDDDYWDKDFLWEMFNLSIKYEEVNIFHSRVAIINEVDKVIDISTPCGNFEDIYDFLLPRIKCIRKQYLSDFLVRTSNLLEIGGFFDLPDGIASDDITWFQIAKKGGVAFSNKLLYYYRSGDLSISKADRVKERLKSIPLIVKTINDIIDEIDYKNIDSGIIKRKILKQELKKFYHIKHVHYMRRYLSNKKFLPNFLVSIIIRLYKLLIRRRSINNLITP